MSFCIVRFFARKDLVIVPTKYVLHGIDSSDRNNKMSTRYVLFNPENLNADVPSQNMLEQLKSDPSDEMKIGLLYPALIFGVYGKYLRS